MIPTIKDTPYLGEFECHYRKTNLSGEEITGNATGVIARDSSGRSVQQYNRNPFGGLVPPLLAIILSEALAFRDTKVAPNASAVE